MGASCTLDDFIRAAVVLTSYPRSLRVVRAPELRVPAGSRANVERVLRNLEEAPRFDALPTGAGPRVAAGDARTIPLGVTDAPAWVREVLLTRPA